MMRRHCDTISKGYMLLANPFIYDDYFTRTAIAICTHNKIHGSVGFILNKPLSLSVRDLIDLNMGDNMPVYSGGPVSTNQLYFLHNMGSAIVGSQKISEQLYWGGDLDFVKSLIETNHATAVNFKFFLGYSGWGVGQLENEINVQNAWLVSKMTQGHVFSSRNDLWKTSINHLGDVYKTMSRNKYNPSMN